MANACSSQKARTWEQLSDGVLLVGLITALVCFGGRHPWGYAGLIGGGLLAATVITARRIIYSNGRLCQTDGEWLILGGVSILLVQLIPLPKTWLSALSPQLDRVLLAWGHGATAGVLGSWDCLSLAPEETRIALSLWLAYSLIFFYTVQRIEDVDDVEMILRWLVPIAILLSALGLLQYFFSNNKFFWVYAHPFAKTNDAVKASFTNRNHFAQLMALAAGPLLWWYLPNDRFQMANRIGTRAFFGKGSGLEDAGVGYLKWLALPIVLLALLLTQSRGGTLAATFSLTIAGISLYRTGILKNRWLGTFAWAIGFLVTAVFIIGTDMFVRRWEAVAQLSLDQIDPGEARRAVWRNTWHAAQDFLATGSGCGTFSAVYPLYQTSRSSPHYYTHAENSYLQLLLETGIPGIVLLGLGCMTLIVWTWRAWKFAPSARHRTATGMIAAGLLGFAFHGLIDYVWYVPALAAVVAIFIGCLARLHQMAQADAQKEIAFKNNVSRPRQVRFVTPWSIPTVALVLCSLWEVPALQRAILAGAADLSWHHYLSLYRVSQWPDTWQKDMAAAPAEPSEPGKEFVPPNKTLASVDEVSVGEAVSATESAENLATLIAKEQEMTSLLISVIRQDPGRAEAHLRLAKAYLRLFDLVQRQSPNPMPLSQIRDAVMLSGFASQEELDRWLHVAIGDHINLLQRAREESLTALRLCPLLGEGYFVLGQLSFLDGGKEDDVITWFRQALRVRPYDGELLFRVGAEFALMGRQDEATSLWQRAFQCGRLYRFRLLERLIGNVPSEQIHQEITFLIDTFGPDLESLRYMYHRYRKQYPPEYLEPLRQAYTVALVTQLRDDQHTSCQRAELWLELHFLYLDGGNLEQALQCAEQAVRSDPLDYRSHYYLSLRLEEMGRFAEAEEHVRWCLQRRPGHNALRNRLHNLYQKRMKAEDEARAWRTAEAVPATAPRANR
ncbi:MAG: O-antigen ligase family protein [Thermogutta sp.]